MSTPWKKTPTSGNDSLGPCEDLFGESRPRSGGSDGDNLQIGRVIMSLDAPGSPPCIGKKQPSLDVDDFLQSKCPGYIKRSSVGSSIISQVKRATSRGDNVRVPPMGNRPITLTWGATHSELIGHSSTVQTYNITGAGTDQSSITTKPTGWTASFDADRVQFQSISVMCEQRLRKACVMTEHALMPDEFRTMAACEAFGTMLPVFERYNSLVTLMIREIIRSVYEDSDVVSSQFLAWLHPGAQEESARAPAEVMLLKSKPYFVRCRELKSQIRGLQTAMLQKEKHEGNLLNNLMSARNSMRSLLGKESLLITRLMFAFWKSVMEAGIALRRRFQRARLRIWFSGFRKRLTKIMSQETKYQLGLRERELQLRTEPSNNNGGPGLTPSLSREVLEKSSKATRAATTRELIATSLIEQAKSFMAEVQMHEENSSEGNTAVMASVTRIAEAAKLAQEQIRLDIGDDGSPLEDQPTGLGHSTIGTQTDPVQLVAGLTSGGDIETPPSRGIATKASKQTLRNIASPKRDLGVQGEDPNEQDEGGDDFKMDSNFSRRCEQREGGDSVCLAQEVEIELSLGRDRKLSRYALQAIVIPEMYAKKMTADASDNIRGEKRTEPAHAIEAFIFENCNGDANTSLAKLATLRAAVRKYGSSGNGRIGLFGILIGWVHEQSYLPQAMDLYLAVMSGVFKDKSNQLHGRMIRGEGLAYMPLETVAAAVDMLLPHIAEGEHFQDRSPTLTCGNRDPNQMFAVSEARKMELTRSLLSISSPAGETRLGSTTYASCYKVDPFLQVVDIDSALEKVMRTWFEQRHEYRRQLAKTIELYRGAYNGERLDFSRFGDMMWGLSGYAMGTPTVHRLFELTATPDMKNRKNFGFNQASALAEQILRMVSHFTPDKDRALTITLEGNDRFLKEKAEQDWQEISKKATSKTRGERLRLYVMLQARMRGWKIRWNNEMAKCVQRFARGYITRRRGVRSRRR